MAGGVGLPELLILLVMTTFGTMGTIFWVWSLIDCATKEPSEGNEKVIWILIILFTHFLGALLYTLIRRPKRKELYGK